MHNLCRHNKKARIKLCGDCKGSCICDVKMVKRHVESCDWCQTSFLEVLNSIVYVDNAGIRCNSWWCLHYYSTIKTCGFHTALHNIRTHGNCGHDRRSSRLCLGIFVTVYCSHVVGHMYFFPANLFDNMDTGLVIWILYFMTGLYFLHCFPLKVSASLWFSKPGHKEIRFTRVLVFAGEKVKSTLGWAVLITWLFVMLIITSGHTASLTSIPTVEKLSPTFHSFARLIQSNDSIGFQGGSCRGLPLHFKSMGWCMRLLQAVLVMLPENYKM